MLSSSTELQEVLHFAPEWEQLLRNWETDGRMGVSEFLNRLGAKALYRKALSLKEERSRFVTMLRDSYFQPTLNKMLTSNQNFRRFLSQRHVATDEQRNQVMSYSIELAQKMETSLLKQLNAAEEDGFKVLLPAYIQRSVHNAVIDYIRQESTWEKQTLQDLYLDPQQDDPRTVVADDIAHSPEQKALSGEQVGQLNQLRRALETMLKDGKTPQEPLTVVDCIFGLGLTSHSSVGEEMTMREVCEKLDIQAETLARRIARCQVLLDKGLDLIRQKIYSDLPGVAECWQRGLNVNTASRRELTQQLGMTEGEIERLIKGRQFNSLEELVSKSIIKPQRIKDLVDKGAAAAFVPVDINSATNRDIMDILGVAKEVAQKLVSERPFADIEELVKKNLVPGTILPQLVARGAVVRSKAADAKRIDLNRCPPEEFEKSGVDGRSGEILLKSRPFLTWSEVEDVLGSDSSSWAVLRQRFFLGQISG